MPAAETSVLDDAHFLFVPYSSGWLRGEHVSLYGGGHVHDDVQFGNISVVGLIGHDLECSAELSTFDSYFCFDVLIVMTTKYIFYNQKDERRQ